MVAKKRIGGKVVVDTSVIVKWLTSHNEQWLEQADLLMGRVESGEIELIASIVARYEVLNAVRYKALGAAEKLVALTRFFELPIEYYDVNEFQAETVLSIALAYEMTIYDASFVELTERCNCMLVTADAKDQGKFPGGVVVELKDFR